MLRQIIHQYNSGKTFIMHVRHAVLAGISVFDKPAVGIFCFLFLCMGCVNTAVVTAPSDSMVTVYDDSGQKAATEANDNSCAYFYFLWGATSENNHRYDEALEAYEKALLCDEESEYVRRKLAILFFKMDRRQQAADLLEQIVSRNPGNSENKVLLAKVYRSLGRNDEAVAIYKDMLATNEDHDTLLMLGTLYAQTREYDKAAEILNRLIQFEGGSYLAHYSLARLYIELQQYDKAAASFEKALELNWSEGLAYELAEFYEKQQEYEKAAEVYRRIIAEDGETADMAKTRLVNIYLSTGENDKALELLRELRTVLPESHNVDLTISRILLSQEKYGDAIMILEDVLKTNPELTVVHYLLAMAYYRNNEKEKAEVQLKNIPGESNLYEDSIFLRVRILNEGDDNSEAIELLEGQISEAATRRPDFYILLASLYSENGAVERARQTYEQARRLYPEDVEVLYNYGIFLEKSGDSEAALATIQSVIALDPEHGAALNYVGYTWADNNRNLDKALEYIEKAVELLPEDGYVRDSLGWVYFRMGDIPRAIAELEKAAGMVEEDPVIREHLGDVYLQNGEPDKALAAYRKSYELYQDAEKKKSVGDKIDSLESRGAE